MTDKIVMFQEEHPSLESYWRSIVLFGNNVASYKFALAKSLLEIAPTGKHAISLDDLAEPYAKHICSHLLHAPKQATSGNSRFLQACMDYNDEKITHDQLMTATVRLGFNNVIDAFHHVNRAALPVLFFEKDYTPTAKRIVLTDALFRMDAMPTKESFAAEAESRWNLVETAWELGISRNLLNVSYDDKQQLLFVDDRFRRRNITSVRGALNGYQKGKCFYCYDDIIVTDDESNTCDVDHFYPHIMQRYMRDVNLDGVWNLALSCQRCNRGEHGKFAQVPATFYIERLHKRNEFLINSHHPLRETIMKQTGQMEAERKVFLNSVDRRAIQLLVHRWKTERMGEAVF